MVAGPNHLLKFETASNRAVSKTSKYVSATLKLEVTVETGKLTVACMLYHVKLITFLLLIHTSLVRVLFATLQSLL